MSLKRTWQIISQKQRYRIGYLRLQGIGMPDSNMLNDKKTHYVLLQEV